MIAADSSVLVPALLASHESHEACYDAAAMIDCAVGHALVETYAVITRLPHPYTVPPAQASTAIRSYATNVLVVPEHALVEAIDRFATVRVSGGATYDALIGETASHHGATLLTRDERAADVYERIGVDVRWVAT